MPIALVLVLALLLLMTCETDVVNVGYANFFPAPVPEHNFEVKGSGDVIEKASSDRIQQNGTFYKFTEDIFGSLVVYRDNIVIDGAGHSLQGNGMFAGFFLQGRNNVTIKNVRISNFTIGIELTWDWPLGRKNDNNIFQGNIISNNTYGISCGLIGNATILENTITDNTVGISSFSDNISVTGNDISNNDKGIEIIASNGDIYHNNFINNKLQVICDPDNDPGQYYGKISVIHWYNDERGNYWSDYQGSDVDHDGIGDAPHVMDANNTDNYPLSNPVIIPDFYKGKSVVTDMQLFPTTLGVIAFGTSAVVIGAGAFVYFRKLRSKTKAMKQTY